MKTEKTPHPAAHLLRAIADGEQMQVLVSHKPIEWKDCDHPSRAIRMLGTEYDSAPDDVVRVKPQEPAVIYINGIAVPEPLQVAPEIGSTYWRADLYAPYSTRWDGDSLDCESFALGICHATKAAAVAHADALENNESTRRSLLARIAELEAKVWTYAALQTSIDARMKAQKKLMETQKEAVTTLQSERDANAILTDRIAELEAQLEAVGAGGVEPLRKRECLHKISEPVQPVAQDAERYRWLRDHRGWQVLHRIRPGKSIEYRMQDQDGEWWGHWWPTLEQAIDAARAP